MTKQKILITSALPYANGPLHFGHIAGAYLPGDCYARFERLRGNDVLYICGSDEHGVAITLSAEAAGRAPQDHVDIFHAENQGLFKKLEFSFDHFSRTTWKGHVEPSQQFFKDLLANEYIEAQVTDQLYSEADGRFLADRYVIGTCPKCGFENARGDECTRCGAAYEATDLVNPRSKVTGSPLVRKPTKHWFLMLDKFKEKLLAWLSTKNWKPNVVNFVKGYIDDLRPRAISRDMEWGIPIPLEGTEGKVLYVWFDAPIGYISATKEWALQQGQPDLWKEYWCDPKTKLVNFIGKDNIPFHAVIFPAMVMGQNLPLKLVDELPANEFYNFEGRQFSKSDNWTIDLASFFQHFTADQIRYAIAANAPETADSEFTWKDFQKRCNGDLSGKFGNFVHRTMVFAHRFCSGVVPSKGLLEPEDLDFIEKVKALVNDCEAAYADFRLRKASQLFIEIATEANAYFDKKAPWKDAKDPSTMPRMNTTIVLSLDCARILALVCSPLIPATAQRVWALLGQSGEVASQSWASITSSTLTPGTALAQPEVLFQRVEDDVIATLSPHR